LQEKKREAFPEYVCAGGGLYHSRKGRGGIRTKALLPPTGGAGKSFPRIQGSDFGNVLPCTNHRGAFFVKEAADLCRVFSFYNLKTGLISLFF
jgi:hypothetical protein